MKQRESGGGFGYVRAALEASVGHRLTDADVKHSGTQFENFREGWAHVVAIGSLSRVSHYFKRRLDDISLAVAKCGQVAIVRELHGPGNYDKCRRCRNAMARRVG